MIKLGIPFVERLRFLKPLRGRAQSLLEISPCRITDRTGIAVSTCFPAIVEPRGSQRNQRRCVLWLLLPPSCQSSEHSFPPTIALIGGRRLSDGLIKCPQLPVSSRKPFLAAASTRGLR